MTEPRCQKCQDIGTICLACDEPIDECECAEDQEPCPCDCQLREE